MLKRVGMGALAVLATGVVAVGCSDKKTTITGGGGNGLSNTDQFPATSIASNNVAPDGGGLSPDNVNANTANVKVMFSQDLPGSDGTYGGDGSAIVVFQVTDGALQRVHATHFNGSTFTPPVELKGQDRDETQGANVGATVAIQLCTATYGEGATATGTTINDIRANNHNWLILWNGRTFFNDPRLGINQNTANLVGPHNTVWATMFLKELRDQPVATSNRVGAVSREFNYGFQVIGTEVPAARGGAGNTTNPNGLSPAPAPSRLNAPACDVTSFGLISDGFAGQSSFGGTALPLSDAVLQSRDVAGANAVVNGTDVSTGGATDYVFAHPNVNGATLNTSSFTSGEVTSFVHLFYTQVVNSMWGGGSVTQTGVAGGIGIDGGADLQAFTASFNLATMTFATPTEFTAPVERNGSTTATRAGTAFYPDFRTYNGQLFAKYVDASLNSNQTTALNALKLTPDQAANAWGQRQTGGHNGDTVNAGAFYEEIVCVATFANNAANDGTSGLVASSKYDLNLHGTAGAHDTTNPTGNTANATNLNNILPNREVQNFSAGTTIFGADEGLGDTTIFYVSADNTRAAGLAGDLDPLNVDRAIVCAVVQSSGTAIGTRAAGVNPRNVSRHQADFHRPTDDTAHTTNNARGNTDGSVGLEDPVVPVGDRNGAFANGGNGARQGTTGGGAGNQIAQGVVTTNASGGPATFFRAAMNRTGEYVALAWLQDQGVSVRGLGAGFRQALMATIYQTFRPIVATTQAGTTATPANVEARFATAPQELSRTDLTITHPTTPSTSGNTFGNELAEGWAEGVNSWSSLPASWFVFQGGLGYRGFQSNRNVMNLLWEQSDATEDRFFIRQLVVTLGATGTPTLTLGTSAEFDATPSVVGHANLRNFLGSTTAANIRSTFAFLDKGVLQFATTDLGAEQSATATNGGALVLFVKVTDASNNNNRNADAQLVAYEWTGSGTPTRVVIGRNVHEEGTLHSVSNTGTEAGVSSGASANAPDAAAAYANAFDVGFLPINIAAVPANADLASAPNHSATSVYIYFGSPRDANSSSARSLYTRKYRNNARSTAQGATDFPTIGSRFFPHAGAALGDADYREPTRLDHTRGGNVTAVTVVANASSAMVLFQQDGHIWAQPTTDGETYRVDGTGLPNPLLVDNDDTGNVTGWTVTTSANGTGGLVDSILFFTKADVNGDTRLRARTGFRP